MSWLLSGAHLFSDPFSSRVTHPVLSLTGICSVLNLKHMFCSASSQHPQTLLEPHLHLLPSVMPRWSLLPVSPLVLTPGAAGQKWGPCSPCTDSRLCPHTRSREAAATGGFPQPHLQVLPALAVLQHAGFPTSAAGLVCWTCRSCVHLTVDSIHSAVSASSHWLSSVVRVWSSSLVQPSPAPQ